MPSVGVPSVLGYADQRIRDAEERAQQVAVEARTAAVWAVAQSQTDADARVAAAEQNAQGVVMQAKRKSARCIPDMYHGQTIVARCRYLLSPGVPL